MTIPAILATLLVTMLTSATAEPPAPSDDAAFGILWNDTEAALRERGVIPADAKPDPALNGEAIIFKGCRLPRMLEDAESCTLIFDATGALAKLTCIGKTVTGDPYGNGMKRRYAELKEMISRRGIATPKSYEKQDDLWSDADDWWMSLASERGDWSTYWLGKSMNAELSVEAANRSAGWWAIRVEHVARWSALHRRSEGKESSKF